MIKTILNIDYYSWIFLSFALYNFSLLLLKFFNQSDNLVGGRVDKAIIVIVQISSMAFLLFWILNFFISGEEQITFYQNGWGNHIFWLVPFLSAPISYLLIQGFTLKRLRLSISYRVFISMGLIWQICLERFIIIYTSLHNDFLPSSWTYILPSALDSFIYAILLTAAILTFAKLRSKS